MIKFLAGLHRWISIGLCLMFAAWFASGIVMIYVPFPSLPETERIKRAEVVDVADITSLSESLIASDIERPNRLRLLQYQKRPILVVEDSFQSVAAVFADSSELVLPLTAADASRIAETFSNTSITSVSKPLFYDQWVVHDRFDQYRPFFRVELEDSDQTHLYVSTRTTEVLQRTNRQQRAWNYVGAVIHWIYPTFIRKNWAIWDQLVWWVSLSGIVGVITGLVLGIQHFRVAKRRSNKGLASPFAGWLAWHHKLGFVFGIIVLLWIFSGWLSMDHGRLFSVPDPTRQQIADVRGISLSEALNQIELEDLAKFPKAREFEIIAFDEEAFFAARNDKVTKLMSIESGRIADQAYLVSAAESAITQAWPGSSITNTYLVPPNDIYGNLREGALHENTLRLVLDDVDKTWIHVNLNDGNLVSVMDSSRRIYRWLFNGIHSLDLPGLTSRRPLWDLLIILLMTIGFAFCITGLVLAYKRVTKMMAS